MVLESALLAIQEALARKDTAALWAEAQSDDREVRKAAKRALYILRAQGVLVDAPPIERARIETLPIVVSEEVESCRIGPPDAAGEQLVLVPRKENKGYRLFQAMTSDAVGVTAFEHLDVSRRLLRQIVTDLAHRGLEVRTVPRPQAIALLAQAIHLSPEHHAALQLSRDLPELSETAVATLALPWGELAPGAHEELLADSARLFESPALRGYLPETEVLREALARFEAIGASPLHLNDLQRGEQFKLAMERTIEGYFDSSRRAQYARRLRGLGCWFLAGDENDQAGRAFASAEQLASGESVLLNPFARMLFERAFDRPAPPGQQAAGAAPASLIVAPGSAR